MLRNKQKNYFRGFSNRRSFEDCNTLKQKFNDAGSAYVKMVDARNEIQATPKKLGAKEVIRLYHAKKYAEALELGEELVKKEPTNYEALYVAGVCASSLKKHEKTITLLGSLVKLNPGFKQTAFLFLSVAQKMTGRLANGIQTLTTALEKYPAYYEAFVRQFLWDRFTGENFITN